MIELGCPTCIYQENDCLCEPCYSCLVGTSGVDGWRLPNYSPLFKLCGWIPVSERLPDEHEFVLVCNDDGEMMIAKMAGCYYKYWVYKYCAYDTDCWDENENGLITHWMPLPELPKGGEKV